MHQLPVDLARVLIITTQETPPILGVNDHNTKRPNHLLVHLVPVLAEEQWGQQQAQVALVVKIRQEVPTCHLAHLDNLHLQVRITLELKVVVLTRTDTSIPLLLKHKVIT